MVYDDATTEEVDRQMARIQAGQSVESGFAFIPHRPPCIFRNQHGVVEGDVIESANNAEGAGNAEDSLSGQDV